MCVFRKLTSQGVTWQHFHLCWKGPLLSRFFSSSFLLKIALAQVRKYEFGLISDRSVDFEIFSFGLY